jgi:hypothetical protein
MWDRLVRRFDGAETGCSSMNPLEAQRELIGTLHPLPSQNAVNRTQRRKPSCPTTSIPQPDAALRRLDRLVGTWTMEGNLVGSDERNIRAQTTFRWLPGGFFLEQRARIDFAGQQLDALELIGYDPETDTFPHGVLRLLADAVALPLGRPGRPGSRCSPGTIGSRLATASGSPGSTCWPFAQVGSPGSPASSTLTCIGSSGYPRNCLEAVPARSDEFRRGRVSQCSIAVAPVSDPSGKAPAILIGRVVWAVAERKHRNDPERGRS